MSSPPGIELGRGKLPSWSRFPLDPVLAVESIRDVAVSAGSFATPVSPFPIATVAPELLEEMRVIEERLARLEQAAAPTVIVVRPMTKRQAKKELLAYFRKHPGAYPSDAAVALQLDPARSRDLCAELLTEGKLEG